MLPRDKNVRNLAFGDAKARRRKASKTEKKVAGDWERKTRRKKRGSRWACRRCGIIREGKTDGPSESHVGRGMATGIALNAKQERKTREGGGEKEREKKSERKKRAFPIGGSEISSSISTEPGHSGKVCSQRPQVLSTRGLTKRRRRKRPRTGFERKKRRWRNHIIKPGFFTGQHRQTPQARPKKEKKGGCLRITQWYKGYLL